jgi:acetyl-CoA acetyltransferase
VCSSDLDFNFFIETDFAGGGTPGGILHAILAIESGRASKVLCYKAINGSSKISVPGMEFAVHPYELGFIQPFGLLHPVAAAALAARRYMHKYGALPSHFEAVAKACRKHANRNPNALMYNNIWTQKEYMESEIIAQPLRGLDCGIEADGAAACVVTSAAIAKDLKQPPVYITAAAQSCVPGISRGIKDPTGKKNEISVLGERLFSAAGIEQSDIDVICIYDDFTPYVLMALEDLGFCKKGEGKYMAESGVLMWPDGKLPLNTGGGNLSEGCLDGFNHIIEAVKQLRGVSTSQVDNAEIALVCGQSAVPTSGLILRR